MEFFLTKSITGFILPPTGFILFGLLGVGISLIWKKLGAWVAGAGLLCLLLCSLPVFSGALVNTLQTYPAVPEKDLKTAVKDVDAIVVLAGARRSAAEEFGDDTLSTFSLERVRYAAWVAKRTGLPLIVSGGRLANEEKSLAELMREVLQKEFIVIVDDIEDKSRTTYENAQFTADILRAHNMKKILLITHAWHMPRAVNAFEHFKIKVLPAPTAFYGRSPHLTWEDFIPSADAFLFTGMAVHEIFGELWYEIRYY